MGAARTKPLAWIIGAAISVVAGLAIWKLYGDYQLAARTGPLRAFMREEMDRSERAMAEGKRFDPSACDGNCPHQFLAKYSTAGADAELRFMLQGHPEYSGKNIRYLYKPDPSPGGKFASWVCETDLDYPARSHFPRC